MYLSNSNRTETCWNRFCIKYSVWDVFMYFCHSFSCNQQLIVLESRINHKKDWTHKIPTKKIWTHEIPTRKNFGPTKYSREKLFDLLNAHKKKILDSQNIHEDTMARRQQTDETHNGTWPTKFSTLFFKMIRPRKIFYKFVEASLIS